MSRSTLFTVAVLVTLAAATFAEQSFSLEDMRQEVLARIQAANATVPASAKSLRSYRIIDPFIIAELITAVAIMDSSIIYNYPDFLMYDSMDLSLLSVQYRPQRIEFNYVNRV